ncbi:hypothetical protein D3C80_1978530 [compost metagenome]
MRFERRCELHQRIGENIGDDQIKRRIGTEDRMVKAFGSRCDDMLTHAVENGIFSGNSDSNRVDIGG